MSEPTPDEQLALEAKFMNARLRDAAGYVHATEAEAPNFEMNRIIRQTAGTTEENENG